MNPQDLIGLLHIELSLTPSEISGLDYLEKELWEETRKRGDLLQQNNLLLQKRISSSYEPYFRVGTSIRGRGYAHYPVHLSGSRGVVTECWIYNAIPGQQENILKGFPFPYPFVRKVKIRCENKDVYSNFCAGLYEELEERRKKAELPESRWRLILRACKRNVLELPKDLRSLSDRPLDEALYDILYQEGDVSHLTHVIVGRDTEKSLESISLSAQVLHARHK